MAVDRRKTRGISASPAAGAGSRPRRTADPSKRANDPGDRLQASQSAWEDARWRAREAIDNDPEFAAVCRRAVVNEEPRHEILDSLRAGEFRESGKHLAAWR